MWSKLAVVVAVALIAVLSAPPTQAQGCVPGWDMTGNWNGYVGDHGRLEIAVLPEGIVVGRYLFEGPGAAVTGFYTDGETMQMSILGPTGQPIMNLTNVRIADTYGYAISGLLTVPGQAGVTHVGFQNADYLTANRSCIMARSLQPDFSGR